MCTRLIEKRPLRRLAFRACAIRCIESGTGSSTPNQASRVSRRYWPPAAASQAHHGPRPISQGRGWVCGHSGGSFVAKCGRFHITSARISSVTASMVSIASSSRRIVSSSSGPTGRPSRTFPGHRLAPSSIESLAISRVLRNRWVPDDPILTPARPCASRKPAGGLGGRSGCCRAISAPKTPWTAFPDQMRPGAVAAPNAAPSGLAGSWAFEI